jgi:2-amino-4-hydroxy-6-hydroxymethyldihydropteridine diphosphokinase
MTLCAISLGGNVGDVPATFAAALRLLEALCDVTGLRSSQSYLTAPMGAHAGSSFFNAACVFETRSTAEEILITLKIIEERCGRVQTMHWGPRTIDLDLIFYGDQVLNFSVPLPLVVPHPGCWYRRFVLDPLAELIPEFVHPALRESVSALRERLLVRPLPVSLWGGWPRRHQKLTQAVIGEFADVEWIEEEAAGDAHAVIRCAFPEAAPGDVSRTVVLPDDLPQAVELVRAVLTAALDEPVVMNDE